MTLFGGSFFLFLIAAVIVCYVVPRKYRWIPMLLASFVFYCWGGIRQAAYLLFTSFTVWGGALAMQRIREKEQQLRKEAADWSREQAKKSKAAARKKQRLVFLLVLLVNLGILGVIKYFNFASENLCRLMNALGGENTEPLRVEFLVPLGISFYTFQSLGYLIDIYNGKYQAARNPLKLALFTSFFPQMIQGPIGRYDQMAPQFDAPEKASLKNLEDGALLMLWGCFKKMVIADRLAPVVAAVFGAPEEYGGAAIVLALLAYAFQLYADFSGGIDIVSGAAQLFGIRLAPNFKRPYFATSLGDFWRRWHISLGAWMRDYVFYPFALSKSMSKMSKALKGKINAQVLRALPAALGNILIFLIVGIWHGAQWNYVVWGLYNGLILAFSSLLEPAFQAFRNKCPRLNKSFAMNGFRILRTFVIVLVGYYFDCNASITAAFDQMKRTITDFRLEQITGQTLLTLSGADSLQQYGIVLGIALLILLVVSLLQERGVKIRELLFRLPLVIRWVVLYAFIFFFVTYAISGGDALEGFMYAIF